MSKAKMIKRELDVPCRFEYTNDDGKLVDAFPGVNCGFDCDTCGWNPEEHKRRMETGEWVRITEYRAPYSGKLIKLPSPTYRLSFCRLP